jgi:hypothetical protein
MDGDPPCGVSFAAGNVYIGDFGVVRKLQPKTGRLTTPAGDGASLVPGDGGPATGARLWGTCDATVDPHTGNLVIADTQDDQVRVVAASTGTFFGQAMTAGDIYTIAGDGTTNALGRPTGVVVDSAGNVLIADTTGFDIRVVAAHTGTFYRQAMTAGDIYTVAGDGYNGFSGDGGLATKAQLGFPSGIAVDHAGNLVIADSGNDRIRVVAERKGTFYGQAMLIGHIYTVAGDGSYGYSGDGGPATSAELNLNFNYPGVAVGSDGNLLIGDSGNNRIRLVAVRTGTFYGQPMTAGDIYTVAGNGTQGFSGDGGPATSAELNSPGNAVADSGGNMVIADSGNYRVRVVAASTGTFYGRAMTAGNIYTVAGDGNPPMCCNGVLGPAAEFQQMLAVAADQAGDVAADVGGVVALVPGETGTLYGRPMTAGDTYTVAGGGTGSSIGGGLATHAELRGAYGVALDSARNLIISEMNVNRIVVVAAITGTFYGQSMTAGHIYDIAGDGHGGFSGDGGPATSAELKQPQGVAVDSAGNVLIDDRLNNRIRVAAASTGTFYGQPMTAGDIYTIAGDGHAGFSGDGGPATSAELNYPDKVVADGAGNLVIADSNNGRIRVVAGSTGTFYGQPMTVGDIYTVAGNGTQGFSGDGGPATGAELGSPEALTIDGNGNLVIADTFNQRIRVVAASPGTFYGQPMTVGDIYTVAGNGTRGFSGDGGPATSAEFNYPVDVAMTGAGNLLIADNQNERVRQVTG